MFNEDNTVERMLINAATHSCWQYVKPGDVPRSTDSVLVESWLQEALIRLNPITLQQAEQVIYKLRAAITSGGNFDELVTANDRFRALLFTENTEPFGKDGEYIPIRFFSDDSTEDYCVVTNQWEYPRPSVDGGKRLDLVYLINGIPVCIGEAKSPVRPQVTWADGATDMLHYYNRHKEMVEQLSEIKEVVDEPYTYDKTFRNLPDFDNLVIRLCSEEKKMRSDKCYSYCEISDSFFRDWYNVLYLYKRKANVEFANPILQRLYKTK